MQSRMRRALQQTRRRLPTVADTNATFGEHSFVPKPPKWNGNPRYTFGRKTYRTNANPILEHFQTATWINMLWNMMFNYMFNYMSKQNIRQGYFTKVLPNFTKPQSPCRELPVLPRPTPSEAPHALASAGRLVTCKGLWMFLDCFWVVHGVVMALVMAVCIFRLFRPWRLSWDGLEWYFLQNGQGNPMITNSDVPNCPKNLHVLFMLIIKLSGGASILFITALSVLMPLKEWYFPWLAATSAMAVGDSALPDRNVWNGDRSEAARAVEVHTGD